MAVRNMSRVFGTQSQKVQDALDSPEKEGTE